MQQIPSMVNIWGLKIAATNILKYISFSRVRMAWNTTGRHYFDVQISVQTKIIPTDILSVHPQTGMLFRSHIQ